MIRKVPPHAAFHSTNNLTFWLKNNNFLEVNATKIPTFDLVIDDIHFKQFSSLIWQLFFDISYTYTLYYKRKGYG